MDGTWLDLESKGYVVLRGFLSQEDLSAIRNDYESTPDRTLIANYDAKLAAYSLLPRFEQKLKAISETVRTETGIDADMTSYALYFSIENGINFSWHQDLESFFLFQDHYHYLNFYVPITKGNQKQSNVSIVPFDQLKIHAPEYYSKLVGGGATHFWPRKDETVVLYNEDNTWETMPINIEKLAVTPELDVGDLLLLRGDIIHRTQDTALTERVAISFRRLRAKGPISLERITSGGPRKRQLMENTPVLWDAVKRCFAKADKHEMCASELVMRLLTELPN
ncbi:hypothetical protein LU298_17470 [Komagataeibacter intermedius]|uniref:hypothetical protein n=1 Tax=Acetobacteraceae TaxID=433 RepID=UPI00094FEA46|nr:MULTISPECIES: hypothetical protein [Acetobacteraceae]MCF3638248.1 hypothetical protein [Komagataeibacter intermedius]WEQ54922.1 hypothetical protein LV564_12335 [Komagataeibacter nataicola]